MPSTPAMASWPRTPSFAEAVIAAGPRSGWAHRRRPCARWVTRPPRAGWRPLSACPILPGYDGADHGRGRCGARRDASASPCWSSRGRRRRQGHACVRAAATCSRRLAARAGRPSGVRRRPADPRALPRPAAPRRGPVARRRPRQRRPSGRARLLAPAPAPEGHRGGAVAGRRRAASRARSARPRCGWPGRPATSARARPSSCSTTTARSSSWRSTRASRSSIRSPRPSRARPGRRPAAHRGGRAARLRPARRRLTGHAIEARLYAEDPWDGFVPATGEVLERAGRRSRGAHRRRHGRGRRDRHALRPAAGQGHRHRA